MARVAGEISALPACHRRFQQWVRSGKREEESNIELIALTRSNRRHKTQDGRKLRRYRRRWKVERLFAWMHNFRRLVTRWEYHIENFLGFAHLACLQMLMRRIA